jgi:hypothetical protein
MQTTEGEIFATHIEITCFDKNKRRRGANVFMVKRGCRESSNRDASPKTTNSLHMFENVYAIMCMWADLALPGRVGTDPRRRMRRAGCENEKCVVNFVALDPQP